MKKIFYQLERLFKTIFAEGAIEAIPSVPQVEQPPPARAEQRQPTTRGVTYAIGDIHGEVTLLRALLEALPFCEEDTLVFLGDYLDRGEDSLAAIQALQELEHRHPACVFLRGNHEDAWLECWDGARFTHSPDFKSARRLWKRHEGHIPSEVGKWLEKTLIEYEDAYAYYIHAGVRPDMPIAVATDRQKMWGPKGFLKSSYDWGKPIVCGHWGLHSPLLQRNKICIDTRASRGGKLTAIRLPDRHIFQVGHESQPMRKQERRKAAKV